MKTSLFFLLFLSSCLFAQTAQIDSLKTEFEKAVADSTKAGLLREVGIIYWDQGEYPKALEYFQRSLTIFEELGNKKSISKLLNLIGIGYYIQGDYLKALDYYQKGLVLVEELEDNKEISESLNRIGIIYDDQGDYPKALEYYQKSLALAEELNNKQTIIRSLGNIGVLYKNQGDYPKALEYYQKSLAIAEELGDTKSVGKLLNNIGINYFNQEDYQKALDYYQKSLTFANELDDKQAISVSLGNIGIIYYNQGNYLKALEYYQKSLTIAESLGYKYGITIACDNLARVTSTLGKDYNKAKAFAQKGLKIAQEIGAYERIFTLAYTNYTIDSAMGNWKSAAENHVLYAQYKDSVFNEEKAKEVGRLESRFLLDAKEKEIKLLEQDQILSAEKEKVSQLFIGLLIVLLTGAGAVGLVVIRNLRKQTALNNALNEKNKEISFQNEEIHAISEEIRAINEELSYKNSEINSSLTYAARIQESIMAKIEQLWKYLPDAFIYLRPNSIVSGDFAWLGQISGKKQIILAAVDCTGHGVPGGFMSVMAHGWLRYTIFEKGILEPAAILNELNHGIAFTLDQEHPEKVKEGMDLALALIDLERGTMKFSGAINPLIEIDSSASEVITYKGDRKSVGKTSIYGIERDFHQVEIKLQEGNYYYMFSDGLQDQFSETGKKLKLSGLKSWLLELSQRGSILEGDDFIDKKLMDWKGNEEFVDDCLVLGFRWQAWQIG